jgi:hypothetical protein
MKDEQHSTITHLNGQISSFLSGLLAGVISVTICNPLDIARTRLNLLVLSCLRRTHLRIIVQRLSIPISHTLCKLSGSSRAGEVFITVPEV